MNQVPGGSQDRDLGIAGSHEVSPGGSRAVVEKADLEARSTP